MKEMKKEEGDEESKMGRRRKTNDIKIEEGIQDKILGRRRKMKGIKKDKGIKKKEKKKDERYRR